MEPGSLHDATRNLWVVPVRHHSPACAAHLERLIATVNPAAILVEGPCDFDPLIDLICDPRTRAPVAIVSLRDVMAVQYMTNVGTRRVVSYFPFCAHSPELVALQAAKARGIPAHFIDLPSSVREMSWDEEGTASRSLLSDERPFDVGDYVTALARELRCRDGNEVWDHLFESRLADDDWQGFFADMAHYCACIRAASDPARMAVDGTLVREAQMRALLAQVRAETAGPIVAVVGGFHAGPLLEDEKAKPGVATGGAGRSYLIRYGMRQLDALSGYGAGLPLPGFYDRLWQTRDTGGQGLALDLITGFAAHLRGLKADAPAFPVIANAVEQAERLAALRGRPYPTRDDIVDAIRSSFIKDEIPADHVPLLNSLHDWLTGHAIGEVPPSAGSPPLVEAVRARARALGFDLGDGERRSRQFDIYRKPRHRAASRFCHAMALIDARYGQRTAGPDFRNDAMLDRLHEVWSVGWSPMVEARLIELSEAADTLAEALAFTLAQKLAALTEQGKGRSAIAAIDLFAAACRAGLEREGQAVLALVESQIIEDPELSSIIAALTDLVLLRRGRDAMGITDTDLIDPLIGAAWRRVLILLPDLADGGEDQLRGAIHALADLRGLMELARTSDAPIDLALFDEALALLRMRACPPMLEGALMAFALIDGQARPDDLEMRLRGELASGYVDPSEKLAFLSGIIAIARELLWTVPAIVNALDTLLSDLDEPDFLAILPHLRLALMPLDPREVDRLAEDVAGRIGARPEQVSLHLDIGEAELIANLALDQSLVAILSRDGIA